MTRTPFAHDAVSGTAESAASKLPVSRAARSRTTVRSSKTLPA